LLISIVMPVRRYHCRSILCGWEGNLRGPRNAEPSPGCGELSEEKFYLLEPSRMGSVKPPEKPPR
jgi:hypothetical protein